MTASGWASRARWIALGITLVLLAALPYLVSSFVVNLATQALIFGLFALSINLLAGYGGLITLGQAGFIGIAGYGLAILTTQEGWPLGAAIAGGLVLCVLAAAFFGLLLVRARGTYFVMITLAEGMVVWGIAQRWQELTGGENGITGVPKPGFAQEYWEFYYLALVVVAACTVLIARIVRSPLGLSLKGIREAEDRLPPLGYDVALHKLVSFTISGFFAGVAGVLLAMYNSFIGPSDVFFLTSAEGLLMSILGGVGTLTGAFVGAGVVIYIQNDVSSWLERWQTLLGVVFVLVVLFAPDGIVGAWTRYVWAPLLRRVGAADAAAAAEAATSAASAAVVSGDADGAGPAPVTAPAPAPPAPHREEARSP
ncbi:MAG TPA: branched-chain amino acid ABC transporter permease [Solirubrobacteraceae bacterium]|nr:branched-chain amino acid ABC transporter permease [Solirubrobacteraceae bacterium]